MGSHLSLKEIVAKLASCRGLIPIDLDVEKRELIWRDLGQFHNYEGFFSTSLAMFAQLKARGNQKETEDDPRTDLDVLESDEILSDCIYPSAFIFHAGRCGSTLLSKALARSRANLVFGEAEAHNKIWAAFTNDWQSEPVFGEEQRLLYRHLILAMGRRRLETHKYHVIKFTSTNILLFDLIRSVFPDVPAIFIYRKPEAILRSFINRPPGWYTTRSAPLKAFVAGIDSDLCESEFYHRAVTRFFSRALDAEKDGLRFLNYQRLTAENLPTILAALNIAADSDQLKLMQDQFEYDSKTEYKLKVHQKSELPQNTEVSNHLQGLHDRLAGSDQNI